MSEPTVPASETAEPGGDRHPSPETVIDLLGLLALGELLAFERMTVDAGLTADLASRARMAEAAVGEIRNYRLLADRLTALGADPAEAMAPFVEVFKAYDVSTAPRDFLEALVKVYVGDAVADDFFRAVAVKLPGDDRALIEQVLKNGSAVDFAAAEIRAAIEADPSAAGRLSLWGRRLVGEALNRAQRVAAAHERLTDLIAGDGGSIDELLRGLTRAHQERMKAVGLNN